MCPSPAAHKPGERKKILDIMLDLPLAVHGQHGVEQNLCNQPACGAVDAHSRELAQSRVVEDLVQTTAQPKNEGYHGEDVYIFYSVQVSCPEGSILMSFFS